MLHKKNPTSLMDFFLRHCPLKVSLHRRKSFDFPRCWALIIRKCLSNLFFFKVAVLSNYPHKTQRASPLNLKWLLWGQLLQTLHCIFVFLTSCTQSRMRESQRSLFSDTKGANMISGPHTHHMSCTDQKKNTAFLLFRFGKWFHTSQHSYVYYSN